MSVMAKLINRLILYLFESSRKNSLQVTLDRIDFNQLKPYFRSPYRANSLTRFWNGHWHDFLREIFIHAGMVPVTFFLVRYLGLQPNSKIVRLGGILGAFSVSGAVHEFGFWSAGPIDPTFRSFRFFFFQGVGVCLEQGFRTLTGRRVDGLIGKIWTFSWLIFFGKPMVRVAMKTLSLEPDKLFEKIDEIGLLGLILRPLSLFKLFEALWTFLTHPTLLSWSTTSIPLHWFFFLSLCFFLVFSFLWGLVPIPIFGFVYIPHPTFRSFFVSMSFLDQFAPIHRLPSSLFSRWLYSPVKPSSPCLILLSV